MAALPHGFSTGRTPWRTLYPVVVHMGPSIKAFLWHFSSWTWVYWFWLHTMRFMLMEFGLSDPLSVTINCNTRIQWELHNPATNLKIPSMNVLLESGLISLFKNVLFIHCRNFPVESAQQLQCGQLMWEAEALWHSHVSHVLWLNRFEMWPLPILSLHLILPVIPCHATPPPSTPRFPPICHSFKLSVLFLWALLSPSLSSTSCSSTSPCPPSPAVFISVCFTFHG